MKQLYFVFFLFSTSFSIAQTDSTKVGTDSLATLFSITEAAQKYIPNFSPLSPNAAGIQKYGDYAVNMATGLTDISIPIYTVQDGSLSLPITLRNHSSGHRINEAASWVGWGWSLDIGAFLGRSINGLADDKPISTNYLNTAISAWGLCSSTQHYYNANLVNDDQYDLDPDLFSYATPEAAGKFNLRQNGLTPFLIPFQPVQISHDYATENSLKTFKIVSSSGNEYVFGKDINNQEATEYQSIIPLSGSPVNNGVVTWHLTKILSPTTDDAIFCSYQDGGSTNQSSYSWSAAATSYNGTPTNYSTLPQFSKQERLNTQKNIHKITFTNGEIEFVQSTASEPRADQNNSNYLKTINVYTYESGTPPDGIKTLLKKFDFEYSYFTDRTGANGRLKLDKITESNQDSTEALSHSFDYFTNSYSWKNDVNGGDINLTDFAKQDYFGYFNGKNNTHLIDIPSYNGVTILGGTADRSTVDTYMKEGVLSKITYPTGGFTTFDFEVNKYKQLGSEKLAGGLRVKEIKSFTTPTNQATIKRFEYGSEDGVGVGKLTNLWSSPSSGMVGSVNNLVTIDELNTQIHKTEFIGSNGMAEMNSFEGTPIYYTTVKEYTDATGFANGYSEYTFSFEPDVNVTTPYGFVRDIEPWKRGLLNNKKSYNSLGVLVEETTHTYQEFKQEYITNVAKVNLINNSNQPCSSCPSGMPDAFYGAGTSVCGYPKFTYFTGNNKTGQLKLVGTERMIDGVTTTQSVVYDNYLLPIKTISDNSQAASFHIKTSIFPTHSSYNANSIALALRTQNRIGIPLETIEKDSTAGIATTVFHQKTVYDSFAGTNSRNLLNNLLPKEIWVAPTNGGLEKRVEFVSYATNGNPTEYSVDGRSTSLVWGYNGSLLLGHVQNATASEVTTALATAGINAAAYSVTGLSTAQLSALQAFRTSLPHALVQWYSHRPHIGLSSILSPNGLRTSYAYDGFGRLQSIKDNQGYFTDYYRYQYASAPIGAAGELLVSPDKNAVVHSKFRNPTTDSTKISDINFAITTIQYSDGLGRAIQKVGFLQNSYSWNDVILENTTYNAYGNVVRSTLPTPADLTANGYNGSYKPYAELAANYFYNDLAPFQETTEFDNSPLNRPKITYGAGQAWRDSLRNTQFFYGVAGADVRQYIKAANGDITLSGTYPANSLFKTMVVDEQRDTTITLTDKQGKMIEKRVQDGSGYMVTHYIYDAVGRPLAVIQPEGYRTGGNFTYNSTNYQNSIFAYEYDERGRIKRKHVPNGGWTNYVYDKRDNVVLEQSALQAPANKWSFTKYDALGRVAVKGELESTQSQTNLQLAFNGVTTPYETRNVNTYSSVSYPLGTVTGAYTEYQFYYYDTYDWIQPEWEIDTNFRFNGPTLTLQNAKGLHTGLWSRNSLTPTEKLHRVIYYDNKNRHIQQVDVHPQIGSYFEDSTTRMGVQYYFDGQVFWDGTQFQGGYFPFYIGGYNLLNQINEITSKYHWITENNFSVGYNDFTEYDGIKRLKQQKINPFDNYNPGALPDYVYLPPNPTAPKSQTARKAVIFNAGTLINPQSTGTYSATIDPNAPSFAYGLQTIDYAYHIRGGLRGINLDGVGNAVPNAGEGDLFAYKLDYESAGKWDGNIGKQTWATNTETARSYAYTYDPAKRLKSATYTGVGTENYSLQGLNYDKNGNIKNLQRFGKNGNLFWLLDNLTYYRQGNQLTAITDIQPFNGPDEFVQRGNASYTYYPDGSLKSDDNEQIQNIVYDTFLKQPTEVLLYDGRKIKNYYDGGGTLLKTVYYSAQNTVIETWEFRQGMIFKNGLPYQLTTPDGRALWNGTTWTYEFDYKDHLGNTRVSFKELAGALVKTAETAFDPYGVRLNGVGSVNATQNRYEMQGHEKESTFGLNRINFGARTLNQTTGVWDRIDPMSEKYFGFSPYNYNFNNPIRFIDPDGRLPIPIFPMLIGAAVGGTVEYGFQVASNYANGKSGLNAWTDVNSKNIGISAAAGFATVGLSAFGGKFAQVGITTGIDAAESVAKQINGEEGVTLPQTFSDVVSNKIGGALVGKLGLEVNTKTLARDADRTARISVNDPKSTGRAATAKSAQTKLNNANTYNQAVSGVAGNATQNVSNTSRADMKNSPIYENLGVAPVDATRNNKPLIFIR